MTRVTLRQLTAASLAALVLAIGLPALASAQGETPQQWLRIRVDVVKPDMVQQYEAHKKQMAAAFEKAGQPYNVFRNYSGNAFEYTTVTLVMKFGDLDNPSPVLEALGAEARTTLIAGINRTLTSTTWRYAVPWVDASILTPGAEAVYQIRTRTPIHDGKSAEYRAYLKNEMKPVMEKGGVSFYGAFEPIFGGEAGTVETWRSLKNLAELEGGPVARRVLGGAGAQALRAKAASLVRGPSQVDILRRIPELSVAPAGPGG